jgi:WD40 repeat protein
LWTSAKDAPAGGVAPRDVGGRHVAVVWARRRGVGEALADAPAARLIATAATDGLAVAADAAVVLTDAATGREVRRLPAAERREPCCPDVALEQPGGLKPLRFSPDGRRLLVVRESTAAAVEVWDPHAGQLLHRLPGRAKMQLMAEGDPSVRASAWAADGRTLALLISGGRANRWDATVELWDAEAGQRLRTLAVGGYGGEGMAFRPDGRRLAAWVSDRREGSGTEVVVFDTRSGDELLALSGLVDDAHLIAFSPDGRRLATADNGGKFVKLWDAETGQELLTLTGLQWLHTLTFTSDGHRLMAAGLSGVLIFDATPLGP